MPSACCAKIGPVSCVWHPNTMGTLSSASQRWSSIMEPSMLDCSAYVTRYLHTCDSERQTSRARASRGLAVCEHPGVPLVGHHHKAVHIKYVGSTLKWKEMRTRQNPATDWYVNWLPPLEQRRGCGHVQQQAKRTGNYRKTRSASSTVHHKTSCTEEICSRGH